MVRNGRKRAPLPREFEAIIQRDGRWFTAFCPEVPGANGQGQTKAKCLESLAEAIKLMLKIQEEEAANLIRRGAQRTLVEVT